MTTETARRLARELVETEGVIIPLSSPEHAARVLAAWLRREARAYHRRALEMARSRGRR